MPAVNDWVDISERRKKNLPMTISLVVLHPPLKRPLRQNRKWRRNKSFYLYR